MEVMSQHFLEVMNGIRINGLVLALMLLRKKFGDHTIFSCNSMLEESIEAAFEKLLMTSFKQKKKTEINLKSRLKKKVEESPPWIQNLLNFVELPPIFRRLFLFAFMGGWSIMNSAEGGPAFQFCFSTWLCSYLHSTTWPIVFLN